MLEQGIQDIVEVFTAPLIVFPLGIGWADSIPEKLKGEVTIQRLINVMAGERELATDAEATIYLYTTTLCQSVDGDWVKIYCYLVTKHMSQGAELSPDVRVDELTDYQQNQLNDLKRFIRRSQRKGLDEKRRQGNREECAELQAKRGDQFSLFEE